MDHPIHAGGVNGVDISQRASDIMHVLHLYISHALTPEREKELATLLEGVILRTITTWAKL